MLEGAYWKKYKNCHFNTVQLIFIPIFSPEARKKKMSLGVDAMGNIGGSRIWSFK